MPPKDGRPPCLAGLSCQDLRSSEAISSPNLFGLNCKHQHVTAQNTTQAPGRLARPAATRAKAAAGGEICRAPSVRPPVCPRQAGRGPGPFTLSAAATRSGHAAGVLREQRGDAVASLLIWGTLKWEGAQGKGKPHRPGTRSRTRRRPSGEMGLRPQGPGPRSLLTRPPLCHQARLRRCLENVPEQVQGKPGAQRHCPKTKSSQEGTSRKGSLAARPPPNRGDSAHFDNAVTRRHRPRASPTDTLLLPTAQGADAPVRRLQASREQPLPQTSPAQAQAAPVGPSGTQWDPAAPAGPAEEPSP